MREPRNEINMEYRVVSKAAYRKDSGEMVYRYHIEQSYTTYFRKRERWCPVRKQTCGWDDCFWEDVVFDKGIDAITYVQQILKPVEPDAVLYP